MQSIFCNQELPSPELVTVPINAQQSFGALSLCTCELCQGIQSRPRFHHQVKNAEVTEVDTSGRCDVTYKLVDSTHVTKLKKNCRTVVPVPYFNQTNKVKWSYNLQFLSCSYLNCRQLIFFIVVFLNFCADGFIMFY